MPDLGCLPVAGSGAPYWISQIWCYLGILLLALLLLRLELRESGKATVPLNKAADRGHGLLCRCRSAWILPLAGRGGEGRERKGVLISASPRPGDGLDASDGEGHLPLAGLGGEGRGCSDAAFCVSGVVGVDLVLGVGDGRLLPLGWRGASRRMELVSAAVIGSRPCRFPLLVSGGVGRLAVSPSGAPRWKTKMGNYAGIGFFNKLAYPVHWVLLRATHLRLSPHIRGRSVVVGGPVCFDGVGEDPAAALRDGLGEQQRRSWEAISRSITSTAGFSRSTSKSRKWSIQKPAKGPDLYPTSFVRPLLRLAAASLVCTGASGSSPRPGKTAALLTSGSVVEQEKGSSCFFFAFSEVFSAKVRDLCVLSYLMGSFVIICTSSAWN